MGLLNFRKKNKKNNNLKDSLPKLTSESNISDSISVETPPESYSPVVNSFMTVSSISDITSSSLLDEILSELPLPKKNIPSGNEISRRNIRHSLNLNSNRSNNNLIKDSNTKEPKDYTSNQSILFTRVLHSVASNKISKGPNVISKVKPDAHSADFSNSSDESESDSLSIESLLTAEDSHFPIAWSDSRFSPGFIAKKQEDTMPLMELISRSQVAQGATLTNVKSQKVTKGTNAISPDDTDLINSQRSSAFAIDRMKERHRQEYRRSINLAPAVMESKIQAQKNSPKATVYTHHPVTVNHQYQHKVNNLGAVSNQIDVQQIANAETYENKVTPKKSFSTNTNSQFGAFIKENIISNNSLNVKSSVACSVNRPVKQRSYNCNENSKKYITTGSNAAQNKTILSNSHSNQMLTAIYSSHQPCNASVVPQALNHSSVTKEDFSKRCVRQNFVCTTANNRKSKYIGQDNISLIPTIQEENIPKSNNFIEKSMETTPKLRKEYRRMQQIHKYKYYSVPNLQHLQDNGKSEKGLKSNPIEINTIDTKIINDKKKYYQRMKSEQLQSKNIYNVGDNNQYYKNKFIYRYYDSSQQLNHHHKGCHQRQPEHIRSSKRLNKPQRYDNHQVKTRYPRKPLLLLTPFEPSSTKKYQDLQQMPI